MSGPITPWGQVPAGRYELYADDDDVIGLTVATTYPSGWPIVRTDPPFMDACDEFAIGQFIAAALTNATAPEGDQLAELRAARERVHADGSDAYQVLFDAVDRVLASEGVTAPVHPGGDERQVRSDAAWLARLARGSSWPGEMAQRVEDAADRVVRWADGSTPQAPTVDSVPDEFLSRSMNEVAYNERTARNAAGVSGAIGAPTVDSALAADLVDRLYDATSIEDLNFPDRGSAVRHLLGEAADWIAAAAGVSDDR